MALAKTGYINAQRGTTKQNVLIDDDGNMVADSSAATGSKAFSINMANSSNNFNDNAELVNLFITLANGVTDSLSNKMTVTWEVA